MTALFWVLAPLAAASGFMVFRFGSMARVTISLLVSFLASGALLILLGLDYLGVVVILMMVIEMIIMAVFMVAYMMNPAGLIQMSMYHNKPGSLAKIAHRLADARINIEYCYLATSPDAKKGVLILRASDARKALKVLNS